MKNTLKRLILLVFLPLLITSCASGAGGNNSDSKGDSSSSQTSEEETFSSWEGDIIDLDDSQNIEEVEVDDTVYDYSSMSFTTVNGSFDVTGGKYVASHNDSLAVNSNTTSPFTHGTFSVDITIPTAGDSGIVFGLSSRSPSSFWEGGGTSYYFFFINVDGMAYLGKTDNGRWTAMKTVEGYKSIIGKSSATNLKVLFYGNKIICLINNEIVIAVRDRNYLTGSGFGFRVGKTGTTINNIFASSDKVVQEVRI